MPPQRTIPPAKAIKTERTHEENQERAYIAASRRSDRSLEARVESARRASEIHKRRTGRSLRVTEQDVVNEEMYEEEDDDLPLQYRRLTAQLQTGSTDFNRRLAAYLTNHVAMRSALDQAITNSYAQQYPNAPQFAHNQQSMFPSPLMTQNLQQHPQMTQSPVAQSPSTARNSPANYRSAPYPAPGTVGYRPNHHRSMSTSVTHDVPGFIQNFSTPNPSSDTESTARRMSTPASTVHSPYLQRATSHHSASATSSPHLQRKSPPTASSSMQPPQKTSPPTPQQPDLGPLTMQLPMETQMFLNPALDPNDPMSLKMMAGSEFLPGSYFNSFLNPADGQGVNNSFFNFETDPNIKVEQNPKFHPSYDGMNATLAPSALNLGVDYSSNGTNFGGSSGDSSSSAQGQDQGLWYGGINAADHKGVHYNGLSQGNASGSGNVTPGENAAWESFIDGEQWTESGS